MDDTPSTTATPLTDRALDRLRKLGDGNALPPENIRLLGTEEKTYTLQGKVTLEPVIETAVKHSVGGARGKHQQVFPDFRALKEGVQQHSARIKAQTDWVPTAMAELKQQPSEGWGLHEARITLPNRPPVVLAGNEQCPNCRGQKVITCDACRGTGHILCTTCRGSRYELCYNCHGYGHNPSNQSQPCIVCGAGQPSVTINGMKHIPCRTCNSSGMITCPTCHGARGLTCTPCHGTGIVTEEITLTLVAQAKFNIKSEGVPSGMRRALERLSIPNLTKGHADIMTVAPAEGENGGSYEDDMGFAPLPDVPPEPMEDSGMAMHHSLTQADKPAAQHVAPAVHYEAKIPYADMRMDFAGRKAIVGVFGKKAIMVGVPSFLDTALEPSRAALRNMAGGKGGGIEALTATRALRDALALQLTGKGNVQELRKIYPSGLSNTAANEILTNTRRALHRMTQNIRISTAAISTVISGSLFACYFMTSARSSIASIAPDGVTDALLFMLAVGFSWFVLVSATSATLRRNFTDMKVPRKQKIGKIGMGMLATIAVLFVAMAALAPQKPGWVITLLGSIHI